ncbi:MAG TPA: UDP-N-acetylmuramoyl-tripeptide--D-alanyl-D-alanine ligase [Candidatus Dormibacteraeota bacterium]|jgi:UDP-N-acetylmuramoyl-tripeptide--D-alanyl-D-alanine ligase|nr:UDP-N-acetylmuramoyl-tripeptide--D-alanyl-D-alanine ligase [Candidatus Dormibacteraeota bacterium]
MKLPLWRIAEFVGSKGECDQEAVAMGYSIDSRTLNPGDLFIAISGEHFDGHNYVQAALEKGAVGAIVEAGKQVAGDPLRLLKVDDTLKALQLLGAAARRLWGKPLLAVTGSAGKTTTKEILAHILATRFRVMKSSGNLNNHIGLPLQLLKLEAEHDLGVVEMGMNHAGEIRALGTLAHHDLAVVTTVAPVHLEFFGSLAEIARAKYEIIETLPCGGVAVLNADDEYVSQFGRDFKGTVVTFGIKRSADVTAHKIKLNGAEGSTFELVVGSVGEPVTFPLVGEHNIYNALAAAAAAIERGISPSQAATALSSIAPPDKRGQVLHLRGATIINDCYNSNPRALEAMIDTLASMKAERRILVVGEMLELGPTAEALHRECGNHAAEKKIDVVIGVRGMARAVAEAACGSGTQAQFVETPEQAGEWLARNLRPGDAVLLKASRGVKLERALDMLQESSI